MLGPAAEQALSSGVIHVDPNEMTHYFIYTVCCGGKVCVVEDLSATDTQHLQNAEIKAAKKLK